MNKRDFTYTIERRKGPKPWYVILDQLPNAYIAHFASYQEARKLVESFTAHTR